MLLVLADNTFAKSTATFVFVLIVVGIVYGSYKLFERFNNRRDD